MEEVKVSVVVPVYNSEKYLVECLDGICNQTFRDIEILLVNDESSDGSLQILEAYAKKDDRVHVIHNVHEGEGAASARNHGLRIAKGKYVLFLDHDDCFDLTLIEKAYTKAERYSADIVTFEGVNFHDATGGGVAGETITLYCRACKKRSVQS